ncbi:MAG: fibronectin type III domain-containing protein [Chloroflexota bacterium]|nr:fibronectin type III domain-containing protein [Chloroflexota bacterium]
MPHTADPAILFRRAPRVAPAIVLSLVLVFLVAAAGGHATPARAAVSPSKTAAASAENAPAPLKAVIIVGPTHDLTAANLERGKAIAHLAASHGMDVRRVFHPNATWKNVLANIQGAHLVAYLGHGNGWPSPYGPFQERTKNGFGLNPYEGGGKNNVEYHGANDIRSSIDLATNSIVLLNHLCYAPGNGEPGMAVPSWSVAHQRVDNFAAGFLSAGARAVFAYSSQSVGSVVQALFTTNKSIEQIFTTAGARPQPYYGYVGWDARKLQSVRVPGAVNFLDPAQKEGFQRAVSGDLRLTAGEWRNGSSGGASPPSGGSSNPPLTADTTSPSVPKGLTAEALGYRRVALSWQASKDDRAGTIRYRIFRSGVRVQTISGTSYVDRPLVAGTYTYTVRAIDVAGNKSAPSAGVTARAATGALRQ